jgi:hypothetical protein
MVGLERIVLVLGESAPVAGLGPSEYLGSSGEVERVAVVPGHGVLGAAVPLYRPAAD